LTIAEKVVDQLLLPNEPPSLQHALRMRLLAAQLVTRYGRTQVLEWHINSAYYGRLAYGAESGAQLYFGKSAAELDLPQAALLAAIQQAPALNPLDAPQAAAERLRAALELLLNNGTIDQEQAESAMHARLQNPPVVPSANSIAPAFTSQVLDLLGRKYGRGRVEMGGLRVTTSLDMNLQTQLTCTLAAQLLRAENRPITANSECQASRLLPALPANFHPASNDLQGSAILLDPATGQVLALAGDSTSTQEGSSSLGHEPGTLLTPFLAVSAFSRGFGPASLVWDIPGQLTASLEQTLHPDHKYTGPLRLRQALANDTLSPLQQLLNQIGSANTWQLAVTMGVPGLGQSQTPEQLLFGGGAVHLVDMAQAYATIDNLGVQYGQRAASGSRLEAVKVLQVVDDQGRQLWMPGGSESQPVLTSALAYLVQNVLSDEPARWPSLGYPNLLEIGRPAGAKMGRTQDSTQIWTAGYTPQRLVITWMGLPAGSAANQPLDPRLAAGLWNALIQYAVRDLPAANWAQPVGVSKEEVCSPSGLLPTRACPNVVSELFLTGNEPTGPDSLYRTFQVNRETGLLATVFTPPDLVDDRTFLVLPEEAQSWGQVAGLPVPPQTYDHIQPPEASANVQINDPAQFAVVKGNVAIWGSAAGSGFSYYQLQSGEGLNPPAWLPVGTQSKQPVKEGLLGNWDTSGLNGLYALRLQVVRQDQHLETAILQVTVDNTAPRVRLLNLIDGQQLAYETHALNFLAEASDAVGLDRVEFTLDGRLEATRTTTPYNLSWFPLRGPHTLRVIAYDLAGNSAETLLKFTVN
jgi:membrane peptidoglycan carboxypeptidase